MYLNEGEINFAIAGIANSCEIIICFSKSVVSYTNIVVNNNIVIIIIINWSYKPAC